MKKNEKRYWFKIRYVHNTQRKKLMVKVNTIISAIGHEAVLYCFPLLPNIDLS